MKTFKTPKTVTVTKSFCLGTFQKDTYYTGVIGEEFTAIAETKVYYITTNEKNNKLPKWATE